MNSEKEPLRGREAPSDASRPLTVSRLNEFAKAVLESRVPPVWVIGEIAEWKINPNGHCYFTLTDKRSLLRCVLFARDAERLPMLPSKGMQIRAYGHVTLYEQQGAYQLQVQRLEAEAEGGLRKLYIEKTRKKLAAEGLLPKPGRRPLPRFPMTVGVVTSPVGAALDDILTVVRRRAPWTRIVLSPAKVQGEGAANDVVRAMRALYKLGGIDVMIVARGGGSTDDLWAFEDEALARAIAKCPIPVVTGIGHATDMSTADMVADEYAATPTAAAEKTLQDRAALDREFTAVRERMARATQRRVQRTTERIAAQQRDLVYEMRAAIRRRQDRIERISGKLHALSPLAALSRGYSVALDENGSVLRCVDDFEKTRDFTLRVTDGRVQSRVVSAEKEEPIG